MEKQRENASERTKETEGVITKGKSHWWIKKGWENGRMRQKKGGREDRGREEEKAKDGKHNVIIS